MEECTQQELKATLARLRAELRFIANLPAEEPPVKKLLHTLSQPIRTVAEAMNDTAETMVGMADILAEPVKELVEGREEPKDHRRD